MRQAALTGSLVGGLGALALAIQAWAAPPSGGDAKRGAQLFSGQCSLCHANSREGEGGAGPPLWDVAGRKAASADHFGYSEALKRTGWTWDDARLDRFLTNPAAATPGTIMPVAVPNAADRRDLIAYLHTLHGGGTAAAREALAPTRKPGEHGQVGAAAAPSLVFADWTADAPGKRHRITSADLPAPFATHSAGNPPKVVSRPPGALPHAPAGVQVQLFASGLQNPRRLATAPNGDIFLAETGAGRVRVLRAAAGVAHVETSAAFAEGLDGPFGVAFYPAGPSPAWVYVAEENRVVRLPYRNGDLKARGKPETVIARLAPTGGGHTTRDLAFTPDGKRLLVSVGSQSNVAKDLARKTPAEAKAWDREHGLGAAWGAEENRADVLAFSPTGGPGKVFASGLRNCVGLAVQPGSGAVWCAVNERDGLGDDLVPDYATRVRESGFYGWPWWYIGDHEEPRLKDQRPDLKGAALTPDVLIQPHSAPMQIAFYEGSMFPQWRGSAIVALHGSWNRTKRTGYKVVRLLMDAGGRPTGAYEDLLTGFVLDDARVWGRPVGVTVAKDGALLIGDDGGGVIWRLAK